MGTAECGSDRRCKNTYGNYMCLCPLGFKFAYVDGELECVGKLCTVVSIQFRIINTNLIGTIRRRRRLALLG